MAKFARKGKGKAPKVNTASLPDIIFMLLFFFMVVTQLREMDRLVIVQIPAASEVAKLERKDLTSYIYIGMPVFAQQARYGSDTRIQLNDSFKTATDIRDFIVAERQNKSESDQQFMSVSIKADIGDPNTGRQGVRMGTVTDVKQELRRVSALRVVYAGRKAVSL